MKTRILTAVVALPLLIVVVFVLPWSWPTAVLFGLMCAVTVHELLHETGLCRNRAMIALSMAMAMLIALYSWLTAVDAPFAVPKTAVYAAVFVYIIGLFCALLRSHLKLPFYSLGVAVVGGLVIPWMLSAIIRLRVMEFGRINLGIALILAMTADTAAYFVGRAFGKHKLAPVISPKKTVEGAIGGVLFTVLFMEVYCLIFDFGFGYHMNYLYAAIYGAVGSVLSIVGDLTFSVAKRQVGIKDYGKILPGHGGILDRFDSMIVVAPLTELLVLLLPVVTK